MEQEQWLIEKYSAYIWAQVHQFAKRIVGYGTLQCSPDDLYQECVLYVLRRFRREEGTIETFRISGRDLLHVMCQYMLSTLPVKTSGETRCYTELMRTVRRAQEAQYGDMTADEQAYLDAEFAADVHAMTEDMKPIDRQVAEYLCAGHSMGDIRRKLSIPNSTMDAVKHRLAKRYSQYMAKGESP